MKARTFIVHDEADRKRLVMAIGAMPLSRPLTVTVEEYSPPHSLEQGGLYWRWMNLAAKHTGHTSAEMHEHCKEMFCPAKEDGTGKMVKSTRLLSEREMSVYLDRVDAFLSGDLGVVLPATKVRA